MPCNSKHEEFDREKMLCTRCRFCITGCQDWGDWADNHKRKETILKSRSSWAIKQVIGWRVWANVVV